MLDYETDVKAVFVAHLAASLSGRGRIESAGFHTAQHIYLKGVEDGLKAAWMDDAEVKRVIGLVG